MYSHAVCSRDDDRAELSAVVWTIKYLRNKVPYLLYSFQVQTVGEMNIGYALTSQNITFRNFVSGDKLECVIHGVLCP